MKNFSINCTSINNNCCFLKNGICISILNIIKKQNNDIFVIGKKLRYVKNLYELPCQSSDFEIKVMALTNNNISSWPITDVLYKAWKIPCENDPNIFAIFPINHTI